MSRLPETGPSLLRRIRQQERVQARQVNASPFSRSGSGVTGEDELTVEGLLRIIGQMVVDGTLVVNGPTTLAGALGITGDTTIAGALGITGDTEVGGTLMSADFDGNLASGDAGTTGWAMNASRVAIGELFLRPGSIGNDELANPVGGGYGNASYGSPSSPASISMSATTYATATIAVPAGFSRALVIATSSLAAQNATVILMESVIAGNVGPTMSVIADASGWANGSANYARELTGLSGSFTVATRAQAGVGGVSGMITTSALVIFLRS